MLSSAEVFTHAQTLQKDFSEIFVLNMKFLLDDQHWSTYCFIDSSLRFTQIFFFSILPLRLLPFSQYIHRLSSSNSCTHIYLPVFGLCINHLWKNARNNFFFVTMLSNFSSSIKPYSSSSSTKKEKFQKYAKKEAIWRTKKSC